jgi:hypothetical protein
VPVQVETGEWEIIMEDGQIVRAIDPASAIALAEAIRKMKASTPLFAAGCCG